MGERAPVASGAGEKITKLNEVRHLTTYGCNLRCKHCYLDAGTKKDQERPAKELTQEELDGFYGQFRPETVSATGGEPLLQLGLVKKIARSVARYGGSLELVTNGFLLTEKILDELLLINPDTFVQISLDGTEKTHNEMRNHPSAYKKAMGAIKVAAGKGILVKVRLTATSENVGQLPEIVKNLDELKRENITLVIRPILSAGRAKENKLSIDIDYKRLDDLQKVAKYIKVETTDNQGKCGCGVDTVAIDPRGDVYPCTYFVFNDEQKMGNITDAKGALSERIEFKKFKGACFARQTKLQ